MASTASERPRPRLSCAIGKAIATAAAAAVRIKAALYVLLSHSLSRPRFFSVWPASYTYILDMYKRRGQGRADTINNSIKTNDSWPTALGL